MAVSAAAEAVAEPATKRPRLASTCDAATRVEAPLAEALLAEAAEPTAHLPAGVQPPAAVQRPAAPQPLAREAAAEQAAPRDEEGAASGTAGPLAERLEVSGALEPGFNQTYSLVPAPRLLEAHLARTGASLRPWARDGAGAWAYQGATDFDEGRGPPYIWCQRWRTGAVQWKLAAPGEERSSYGSHLDRGRAFPEGLCPWRRLGGGSGGCQRLAVRALGEDREACVPQPQGPAAASGAFPGPHPDDPLELPGLGAEEAEAFHRDGYLVLRAASLGTAKRAARARRAMSLLFCRLVEAALLGRPPGRELELSREAGRDGVHSIRVRTRKDHSALLSPLRRLLAQMLGEEPELPASCQLAFGAPDGGFGEDVEGREEERPDDEYHIDGRGSIPNGFALLVGVALSSPPTDSRSWGAFAVFPGSHRNSELHARYPLQKRGGGADEGRLALGPPKPLRLEQGDVVVAHSLLAHRRSQNWSSDIRYQLYFRLRPRRAASDAAWERGLPADPFAALPGVVAARRPAA